MKCDVKMIFSKIKNTALRNMIFLICLFFSCCFSSLIYQGYSITEYNHKRQKKEEESFKGLFFLIRKGIESATHLEDSTFDDIYTISPIPIEIFYQYVRGHRPTTRENLCFHFKRGSVSYTLLIPKESVLRYLGLNQNTVLTVGKPLTSKNIISENITSTESVSYFFQKEPLISLKSFFWSCFVAGITVFVYVLILVYLYLYGAWIIKVRFKAVRKSVEEMEKKLSFLSQREASLVKEMKASSLKRKYEKELLTEIKQSLNNELDTVTLMTTILLNDNVQDGSLLTLEKHQALLKEMLSHFDRMRGRHFKKKKNEKICLIDFIRDIIEKLSFEINKSDIEIFFLNKKEDHFLFFTDPPLMRLFLIGILKELSLKLYRKASITIILDVKDETPSVTIRTSEEGVSGEYLPNNTLLDMGIFTLTCEDLPILGQELSVQKIRLSPLETTYIFKGAPSRSLTPQNNVIPLYG
ncbi:MAG: hypothetical protein ACK5TR_01535 [Alphaproteobacteria bacterium]|jgi:hypothetical protein